MFVIKLTLKKIIFFNSFIGYWFLHLQFAYLSSIVPMTKQYDTDRSFYKMKILQSGTEMSNSLFNKGFCHS